jgi:hypothetical protein
MADVSILSRLVNGVQRNVDLSSNTIVVSSIKVGGSGGTVLTKAILDRLISLQDGSDIGATYHTHDGRYFTETELGAQTNGASGASLIGIDVTPAFSNFTSGNNVQSALEGIDSALASAGGGLVKVSAADTTSGYLDASLTAGSGLSKSITNPGANEVLDLAVNVDGSSIEINADTLRVKASGITSAMLAGSIDATKIADGSVTSTEFQYINTLSSNAQDQLDAKVAKAGSSMTSAANITFSGGGEVLGLPSTPSAAGAAASKAYVDAVALGLAPKKAVRVATLVTGTLASSFENGDVIDGITLVTGDRILIKDQSTASQNGIYTVNASGAPTRATDMDSLSPIDEVNGAWVPVQLGTQAGQIFVQYGVVSTIGTDAINFEFYNPLAALVGGDMITNSGSTFSVDLASTSGLESTNAGNATGQLRVKLEASNPSLKITGSNELGAKLDGSGAITSGASGLAVGVDGSTVEISANALRVKDAGITSAKLAAAVAGAGLTGGAGSALAVGANADSSITVNADDIQVKRDSSGAISVSGSGIAVATDDVTIEKSSNAIRVKDLGISTAKLAATSVTAAKLGSDVAGAGLAGGNGSAITVSYAPSIQATGEIAGEAYSATTLYAVRYGQNAETAGRLYKADNDATSTDNMYVIGLVLTVGALSAANTMPDVVKMGPMTVTGHGFTVGKPVYLGASGALTSTAPTTSNLAVVRVGMVKSANIIDVNVQVVGVN